MKFFYYDLVFLVAFCLFLIIFLYKRRKNLKREWLMYLYKTKVGIKFIDFIGTKYKKTLRVLRYFSLIIGYALMVSMIFLFIKVVYTYIFQAKEIVNVISAPPIMPLIPYFPQIFGVQSLFPPFYFTYFILSILVVAVVHEFSHGIFARFAGIKIKSTGFAFLGPLVGAFVEPDEKQMLKKSKFTQMSILSAGVFANIITALIFILIAWIFLSMAFTQSGAIFSNYVVDGLNVSSIVAVGNYSIENLNAEKFSNLIENNKIENDLIIQFNEEKINLTKIKTEEKDYFTNLEVLKKQLESGSELIGAYGDYPAISAGLKGTVIEFNNVEIKNQEDFSGEIARYKPGDEVNIKTRAEGEILSYDIKLGEYDNQGKAFLGVSSSNIDSLSYRGILIKFFNSFKDPSVEYTPKFNSNFVIFIRDLLWWIIIINVLVALFNMLPAGFLDGGRFFYLTVLAITKSEKTAKKISKGVVYVILLMVLIIMGAWLFASLGKFF